MRLNLRMNIFWLCLLNCLYGVNTLAHPLDLGLMQIDINAKQLTLDLNATLVAQLLNIKENGADRFQESRKALSQLVWQDSRFSVSGTECQFGEPSIETLGQSVRLVSALICPIAIEGPLKFKIPFVLSPKVPSTFQMLVKITQNKREQLHTLKGGVDELELNIAVHENHFGDFILMGIEHIGAAPSEWRSQDGFHFPEGIDHILFLCALLMVGGGFWELLKTATGFTVGHSVTLALASLNIVRLPSQLVESAIALSIAYVAIETLVVKKPRHRWKLAAAFGLVHGFGFATVLGELALQGKTLVLALVGFNAGVELGQIIIMAFIFPVLLAMDRVPKAKAYCTKGGAALIGVLALYWFFQRALE